MAFSLAALDSWSDFGRAMTPSALTTFRKERTYRLTQRRKLRAWERDERISHITDPVVYGGVSQVVGFGDSSNPDAIFAALKGAASSANRVIRDRQASLPMGVFARRFQNGQLVNTPLFEHPLQRILNNPTMDETGVALHDAIQFWGLQATQFNTLGEAILFIRRDGLGAPMALQIARPGTVRPIRNLGRLVGYEVIASGGNLKLLPGDVVRIWDPHPNTLWESQGLMTLQSVDILLEQMATENWKKFYEFDATPKVIWEAEGRESKLPGKEMRDDLAESWFQRFHRRIGTQMGVPSWGAPGWKAKELSSQGEAQHGVTMMQYATRAVHQAWGVPPSMTGDVVDVNRAAAETTRLTFDELTILPRTAARDAALTSQLASQYPVAEGVELIVMTLPFLMEDKEFRLKQEDQDLRLFVRSANEIRESRPEALPAASWAGLPLGPFSTVPITGEIQETNLDLSGFDLETEDEGGEEEEEERSRAVAVLEHPGGPKPAKMSERMQFLRIVYEPENEWQRQVARDALWTPRFQSAQQTLFKRQAEITIENYAELVRTRSRESLSRAAPDDAAEAIFPTEGWEKMFKRSVGVQRRRAFQVTGNEVTSTIIRQTFRLDKAAEAILLQQDLFHLTLVNQTTRSQLAQVLAEAAATNATTGQTAREIETVFNIRLKDARRIARTEMAGAVTAAQQEGFKQTGVVEGQQWNTSLSGVRDSHQIEGQIVALGERFVLANGVTASGPGDPVLSASDRANCFPAGTLVEGDLKGALKTWYSGEMIEVHTVMGHRLSLTPNHPVATPKGFVPACALREGDQVLSYRTDVDPVGLGVELDEQQDPAPIEQVFRAFEECGSVGAHRMPVAPADLHGDGASMRGEIHLVGTDEFLRAAKGSEIGHRLLDLDHEATGVASVHLADDACDGLGSLGTDLIPTEGHGGAAASRGNASVLEDADDLDSRDAEVVMEPEDRGAALIRGDDRVAGLRLSGTGPDERMRLGQAASWNVGSFEYPADGLTVDAEFAGNLTHASSGLIGVDHVTGIRHYAFTGHVYDLHSVEGWIVANNVVTSQCRCFVTPVFIDENTIPGVNTG